MELHHLALNVCEMDTLSSKRTSDNTEKMSIRVALCPAAFAQKYTKSAT